jgi:phosphoribosyl 1,2-cyclic phosphate phosphodiesterase
VSGTILSAPVDVTFLGTGTSMGVPMIGCTCAVCTSTDPRDTRARPSILVRLASGATILVDTSSDLRAQALRFKVTRIDAVLYTHSHADHILGLDELRRFNTLQQGPIPLYGDERTLADLKRIFNYAFRPVHEPGHEYVPLLVPFVLDGPLCLAGTEVRPIPVTHGARQIYGFRFGAFAYLTDCSAIPETSWPLLEGLDVVVLDALRERAHASHFNLEQAVAAATRIGARQAYFTHMAHDLGHAATCARLPERMALAHDGLTVSVQEPGLAMAEAGRG